MRMSSCCESCLMDKYAGRIPPGTPPDLRDQYLAQLREIIVDRGDISAPEAAERMEQAHAAFFGAGEGWGDVKRRFNGLMLEMEESLQQQADVAEDPLLRAVQYAMAANFIDFGALAEVDEDRLMRFLREADRVQVDAAVFAALRQRLRTARRLVILLDNCGEIVADKVLLRTLSRLYPHLHVTAVVRGGPVLNDVTLEDAQQVRLHDAAHAVLPSGCATAGTVLCRLSPEAAQALADADVIISKGQGNFESLSGCGLPVFYVFLCKCALFADRFGVPLFTGMLVQEGD